MHPVAFALHVLAAVIWVGGMAFAYGCLRPVAATLLDPPMRQRLWVEVFARFFTWVWAAVAILLGTGLWMLFAVFGGFASAPLHLTVMLALGVVMILIFMHVFFAPYRRLRRCVEQADWPAGGIALGRIRRLVGVNCLLGLAVVALAAGGRYF
ncbi:MAG: CopD family protein [Gammaproteobacteria bacterium]